MTLKKIKDAVDNYNIEWLHKYFFLITFYNHGGISIQGYKKDVRISAKPKTWFSKDKKNEYYEYYIDNINITLSN